ncbi:MAG: long-chain-fatty-acid--CoA ligase [Chloroflexota bacterium]
MNIANWITQHAAFTPDKAAIRFEGSTLTYAQFDREIQQATNVLTHQLGVGHGDRVSILATNIPEYLVLLFACARIGAIYNPLNWRLAVDEHLYILHNAESSVLFVEQEFAQLVSPLQLTLPACQVVGLDFAPAGGMQWADLCAQEGDRKGTPLRGTMDDPILLVYTSGTTGYPKGAVLTQANLFWNAVNAQHMQNLTSDDHVLVSLPLFHVGGLNNQTTPAFHCGATVTLHRRFHPDHTLQAFSKDQPTTTCLVPTMMQACTQSSLWTSTDFSSLHVLLTGSTIIPSHLSDTFREQGVIVLEMYGSTETCPIAIYQRPDSDFSKRGSTGLPALHCQVRVVDADGYDVPAGVEGEMLVKGPSVMTAYWRNDEATHDVVRDGWYYTGDIGYCDKDGYYYIKDRKKNMIISGGENIYAAEVERTLYEHPDIVECAMIGVPDAKWGEKPVAIILASENTDISVTTMTPFLTGKLARYKWPRDYILVDDMPKNAMGKVQHFILREQFG